MPDKEVSDAEAYAHYADPDNRVPAGEGRRRRTKPMSSHVPIRFAPDVIAEVKDVAREDRKTVSSWIRDTVERELERRRPRYPTTGSYIDNDRFTLSGLESGGTVTGTRRTLEDA